MSLFDEITTSHKEEHKKWFERWYEKGNLENKIRQSAQKGYTGYRIRVSDCGDDYLKLRLNNSQTIDLLKEKLGTGFKVLLEEQRGVTFLNTRTYKSYIEIVWE